jgi:hypothetical protein
MRKPESILSIFLGNLFFLGCLISLPVWYWADYMYNVGMDVNLERVIPLTLGFILITAMFFTWITWKVTKGKF